MSAKKNKAFLLSEEEMTELLDFLKRHRITLKKYAEIVCMSYPALRAAIVEKRMLKSWKEHIELREQVKELRKKLKTVQDLNIKLE